MTIVADRERLVREIDELGLISDAQAPAVTRIVFSPTDLKARAWLIVLEVLKRFGHCNAAASDQDTQSNC